MKTVMHRVHARTVSVANLAATQMTSQPPQLQRAMMRVSHKFGLLQGRLPLTQFLVIVKYLFITGGYPNYHKTELVSIDEEFPIPDCIQTLSEHPNELFYAAGGALPDRGEMSKEFFN